MRVGGVDLGGSENRAWHSTLPVAAVGAVIRKWVLRPRGYCRTDQTYVVLQSGFQTTLFAG